MDQMREQHEGLIDKHEDKLANIQQDIIDIKVRLGIKDLTNGQVVEYHKNLLEALHEEKNERKAMDEKLDNRTWYILTAVIIAILLEILSTL